MNEALDCAIVGAGPGGLTAAIYLARYRRSSVVLHNDESRAGRIPASHNCPGFPSGIGGRQFLARLGEQARTFGARIEQDEVLVARLEGGLFVLEGWHTRVAARNLVLATGSVDVMPEMDGLEEAIQCGAMRFCPICDGYEAIDRDIAVYGPVGSAASHAEFIRTYSRRVALVPSEPGGEAAASERLRDAGIELTEPAESLSFDGSRCVFVIGGQPRAFDVVYPMLGSEPRSELARALGARTDEDGGLFVTKHQMTSVQGLYAIGDVVSALDQISVATGHAAVAATAIHNRLPSNAAR